MPLTETGADIYGDLKAIYRQKTGMSSKAATRYNVDIILASVALVPAAVSPPQNYSFESHYATRGCPLYVLLKGLDLFL